MGDGLRILPPPMEGLSEKVRLPTVLIDPLAVSAIRAVGPGEYPDGVQTVLSMGHLSQGVREDIGSATAAIRVRGGKV